MPDKFKFIFIKKSRSISSLFQIFAFISQHYELVMTTISGIPDRGVSSHTSLTNARAATTRRGIIKCRTAH